MRIKQPQPFTFEAGPKAVLLLHGFTGHTADVRMLGRFLERKGYTSHAPIYKGHGGSAEEIVRYTKDDWWQDALTAYDKLSQLGYDEIVVIGLSLGGTLALRLSHYRDVKAIVTMCAPVVFDKDSQLKDEFIQYAKKYKQFEKKDSATIEEELHMLQPKMKKTLQELKQLVKEESKRIDKIDVPTMIVQARHDKIVNPENARHLYKSIRSSVKELKWYENSSHVITLDQERDILHKDIYHFLQALNWNVL